MAWSTPHAWVPGEVSTAALLNQNLRDNPTWLFSGRPSVAAANGTVGGAGGTANVAGPVVDCIYTTDSALDCWDQGWGFTPPGSLFTIPELGYYFMSAFQGQADSVVGAEHVLRIYYGTALIAAESKSSTAVSFGPTHGMAILHRCINEVGAPGTVHTTFRRGGSGTITTWFGFQAVQVRGL